jgi:hypothetical protein
MAALKIAAFLSLSLWLAAAEDPFSGVWTLNLAESKLSPPLPKSQIVRVQIDEQTIRISEEIVSDTGERMVIIVVFVRYGSLELAGELI